MHARAYMLMLTTAATHAFNARPADPSVEPLVLGNIPFIVRRHRTLPARATHRTARLRSPPNHTL